MVICLAYALQLTHELPEAGAAAFRVRENAGELRERGEPLLCWGCATRGSTGGPPKCICCC